MSTQSRNLYDEEQMRNLQREYEGTSFADHVGAVMEAATDDVKSVVTAGGETVAAATRAVGRDIAMVLLGFTLGVGTFILSRFIP